MTAEAVREAVGELRIWLPAAEALIAMPDIQPSAGRAQPSSKPPWNQAAASALLDALEGARQLHARWLSDAAGRPVALPPMSATGQTLASLVRLSYGLPDCPPAEYVNGRPQPCRCDRCSAAHDLSRWVTAILRLPAIDKAEKPMRLPEAECPYCNFRMMRAFSVSGWVACLRGAGDPPACTDADGNPPRGRMGFSQLDGSPCVAWNDGLVT